MRKSCFTPAQIIGLIKEQEAGLPTAELCRKNGLSPTTLALAEGRTGAGQYQCPLWFRWSHYYRKYRIWPEPKSVGLRVL